MTSIVPTETWTKTTKAGDIVTVTCPPEMQYDRLTIVSTIDGRRLS